MRIIIDGNDGVGKTTLAKRLMKDLNIKSYIHLSAYDPRDYGFYLNMLKKDNVIFDRSFMDEIIYSKVFNRQCELTEKEDELLHKYIKDNDIHVIICKRPDKLYDSDESQEVIDNAKIIDDYFDAIALKHSYISIHTHTINNDEYRQLITFLETNK